MCTALTFYGVHHYFGRSLDLEYKYGESVVITPKNYILRLKSGEIKRKHFAMIGMATVIDNYPLYYEATNEYGLSMAGLNFIGNAFYSKPVMDKINLAPYELIPYLLGECKNVDEVIKNLNHINIYDIPFNNSMQNSQLHWLISDKTKSLTLECLKNKMIIYDNDLGVLTNNPPFEFHLMNLNNYCNVGANEHRSFFAENIKFDRYSKGLSGIGLPGDGSSMSRFIRCVFTKFNSVIPKRDIDCVSQFFHILGSVNQVEGSVVTNEKCNRTQYMSCCDMDDCIYYYKTYNNSQINALNLFNENLDLNKLSIYPMIDEQSIKHLN